MRKGIMIAGYYGANNTGDEAILTGMIQALNSQGIHDITVLSKNPEQTSKLHGVKSIYIGRRFQGLINIYQALRKSKLFILGGGGILHDHTARVVPYWLSRVFLAYLTRTPVMYYAQGIGPLRSSKAKRMVKLVSRGVKWITVRDEASLALLKSLGIDKITTKITADPALAIDITSDGKDLLEKEIVANGYNAKDTNRRKIGVALRSWKNDEIFLPIIIHALNHLKTIENIQYYFFPFQYGEDEKVSTQVMNSIKDQDAVLIKGNYTPEQMAALLKEMDGVIAMRLHALILAAISNIPSYGLVYDLKVYHFLESIGLVSYSYDLDTLIKNEQDFRQSLSEWLKDGKEIKEQMEKPVAAMKKLSLMNAKIVKGIIK